MKLRGAVEQYILLKQSLGFRFRMQSCILRAFSRAMGKVSVGQVKRASARAYLDGHGPVTEYLGPKMEHFARLLRLRDHPGYSSSLPVAFAGA